MVTSQGLDAYKVARHKGMGLVNQVFNGEAMRKLEKANLGIGKTKIRLYFIL